MSEIAIKTEKLCKQFNLYTNGLQKLKGLVFKKPSNIVKVAVNEIDLTINKGENVAIMGNIGAGRTTLMRLISGIMFPTSGSVSVNGTITNISDLRAGFDKDVSGRKNIYYRGGMIGLDKAFIKEKEQEIIDFTELGDVIDLPVKSYQPGDIARISFALYMLRKPDILIIDDPIAVKSKPFKQKCLQFLDELCADENVTVIFVSNMIPQVKRLCQRGIFMENGEIAIDGSVAECIAYFRANAKKQLKSDDIDDDTAENNEDNMDDMDDFDDM